MGVADILQKASEYRWWIAALLVLLALAAAWGGLVPTDRFLASGPTDSALDDETRAVIAAINAH